MRPKPESARNDVLHALLQADRIMSPRECLHQHHPPVPIIRIHELARYAEVPDLVRDDQVPLRLPARGDVVGELVPVVLGEGAGVRGENGLRREEGGEEGVKEGFGVGEGDLGVVFTVGDEDVGDFDGLGVVRREL